MVLFWGAIGIFSNFYFPMQGFLDYVIVDERVVYG